LAGLIAREQDHSPGLRRVTIEHNLYRPPILARSRIGVRRACQERIALIKWTLQVATSP
jgi:hypothetical protein